MISPYPFGPRRQAHVDGSWAAMFREQILEELPVERLAKYYREGQGRPSKELYAAMGALLLQQMFDLSDGQTVEQFSFNLMWHYALGITGTGDAEAYLSERTLWTMRQRLIECGLDAELFELTTKKLATVFGVDTSRQRLDSTHLFSNMRHLGRIGLFAATIRRFLVNLRRHHRERFAELGEDFTGRYVNKGDGVFSLVKPSEAARTLEALGGNLLSLVERFKDEAAVRQMSSYGLLVRLLREQCVVSPEDGSSPQVSLKPPAEISSDSLQGPSDPDATYSGHKGKGYTAQVMESFDPARPAEATVPNLITYAEAAPAHVSDVHATLSAIDAVQQRGLGPQQLLADTLYGSDENVLEAKARGVELVTPAAGGPAEDVLGQGNAIGLEDFTIDKKGTLVCCPQGQVPSKTSCARGETTVCFSHKICGACPDQLRCAVRWSKDGYTIRISPKKLRLARRRAREKTPAFRAVYRWRAGIEATMSHLKNLTGAGRLRYRGLRLVRYCIKLKAAGLNIFRAAAALAARIQKGLLGGSFDAGALVRELRFALRALIHASLSLLRASVTAGWASICG
jgi:hypothetical protein